MDYLAIAQECPISIVRLHPEWPRYTRQLRYGHFEVSASFAELVWQHILTPASTGLFPFP